MQTLLFAQAESAIEQARKHYMDEKYDMAIELYEKMVAEYKNNYELYYNLGNAYYKNNNFVQALLNYERAKRLNPNDEDIQHNIEMAKSYQVDNIDEIPQYFYIKYYHSFIRIISSNAWAIVAISAFFMFLVAVYFFFFSLTVMKKKRSFVIGISVLSCSILFSIFSFSAKDLETSHNTAIVITPSVTLKAAPSEGGKDLILIHEGLKVTILEELDDWVNIRLGNGDTGWALRTDVEVI